MTASQASTQLMVTSRDLPVVRAMIRAHLRAGVGDRNWAMSGWTKATGGVDGFAGLCRASLLRASQRSQ
jgi:hypothetical protein